MYSYLPPLLLPLLVQWKPLRLVQLPMLCPPACLPAPSSWSPQWPQGFASTPFSSV